MSDAKLTYKQEKAVNLLLSGMTQSDAYRGSYNCTRMKDTTIHRAAHAFFGSSKIAARVEAERVKALQRNHTTLDEVFSLMADSLRVDPSDVFNEDGSMKGIHEIPKRVRLAMTDIEIEHKGADLFSKGSAKIKKVKFNPKSSIMEMFLKTFGAYAAEKLKIEHTVPVSARVTPEEAAAIDKSLENKY